MTFYKSVDGLSRALRRGAILEGDQVHVASALAAAAGERACAEIDDAVRRAGARLLVSPGVQRVCVLSTREAQEGLLPPGMDATGGS